jgi:hypothetical protein
MCAKPFLALSSPVIVDAFVRGRPCGIFDDACREGAAAVRSTDGNKSIVVCSNGEQWLVPTRLIKSSFRDRRGLHRRPSGSIVPGKCRPINWRE